MAQTLSVELIASAVKGNPQALEELLFKTRQPLFHYASHYLGDPFEAEDVTQEVLLKITKAIPEFKGDASFWTWAFRIMTNACIDYLRKKTSQRYTYLVKKDENDEETATMEFRDDHPQPDELAEQNELRAVLKSALAKLSPEHRSIVILHDLYGFKYHEIAVITQTGLGTIKSRLFYARKELKSILAPWFKKEVSSHALP